MKTTIKLLFLSLIISSCSNDDKPAKECECMEQRFNAWTGELLSNTPIDNHRCENWGFGELGLLAHQGGNELVRYVNVCE
jgi:hypothetical protein